MRSPLLLLACTALVVAQPRSRDNCPPLITGQWLLVGDPLSELTRYDFAPNGVFRANVAGVDLLSSPYSLRVGAKPILEIANPALLGVPANAGALALPIAKMGVHRMSLEIPQLHVSRVYERRPLRFLSFCARKAGERNGRLSVGHGFLLWYTLTGERTETDAWGFYPSHGATPLGMVAGRVPGVVRDELLDSFTPARDVEFTIRITEAEYRRTLATALQWMEASINDGNPLASFNLFTNNCRDFVKAVLASLNLCGERVKPTSDTWLHPHDYVSALKSYNRALHTPPQPYQ